MTLPFERNNAIKNTREFLRNLLDRNKTPRVPMTLRMQAHSLLKHYPSEYEMELVQKIMPEVFGEWSKK